MATAERICETCHRIFDVEPEVERCPEDGGKLHTIDDAEALLGRVIDDKLTLTDILGKGGMGVVYRARQHSMDREVAVRVLNPRYSGDAEAVQRFLHEAKAASALDHPNVITVFDFGRTDDGLLYLVMELMTGRDLGEELERGPLDPSRAVHILTQVCDAIHHAHERGLVHRDLKPDNIFLLEGSTLRRDFVKVLDFGIARLNRHDGAERITRTGSVCGTPAYMAPEQVLGDEIDGRADVYALGLVAYEALTGAHPYPADTAMRQLLAHLEDEVPPFAEAAPGFEVPPELEAAVMQALEKDRERRVPSAVAFADALVSALQGRTTSRTGIPIPVALPVGATPGARAPSTRELRKPSNARRPRALDDTALAHSAPSAPGPRRRLGFVVAATLAAAAVVAIVALSGGSGQPEAQVAPASPPVAEAASTHQPTTPTPAAATEDESPPTAPAPAAEAAVPAADAVEAAEDVSDEAADAATIAHEDSSAGVDPSGDAATEPEAVEEPAVAPVLVTVGPGDVRVTVDGVVVEDRPVPVARPAEGEEAVVRVSRPGFRAATKRLGPDAEDLTITLERRRRPKPATAEAAAPVATKPDDGAPTGGGLIK